MPSGDGESARELHPEEMDALHRKPGIKFSDGRAQGRCDPFARSAFSGMVVLGVLP